MRVGFNSTLVRFKPAWRSLTEAQRQSVSIPLWFDSNLDADSAERRAGSFQFHSGSIQTRPSQN